GVHITILSRTPGESKPRTHLPATRVAPLSGNTWQSRFSIFLSLDRHKSKPAGHTDKQRQRSERTFSPSSSSIRKTLEHIAWFPPLIHSSTHPLIHSSTHPLLFDPDPINPLPGSDIHPRADKHRCAAESFLELVPL